MPIRTLLAGEQDPDYVLEVYCPSRGFVMLRQGGQEILITVEEAPALVRAIKKVASKDYQKHTY